MRLQAVAMSNYPYIPVRIPVLLFNITSRTACWAVVRQVYETQSPADSDRRCKLTHPPRLPSSCSSPLWAYPHSCFLSSSARLVLVPTQGSPSRPPANRKNTVIISWLRSGKHCENGSAFMEIYLIYSSSQGPLSLDTSQYINIWVLWYWCHNSQLAYLILGWKSS